MLDESFADELDFDEAPAARKGKGAAARRRPVADEDSWD
jgi:hypothetical protein